MSELKDIPELNPRTIREYRLALRTPFLSPEIRGKLNEALQKYFSQRVQDNLSDHLNDVPADTKIVHRADLTPALDSFLTQLRQDASSEFRSLYETMLKDDVRVSMPRIDAVPAEVGPLYMTSLKARQLALAHGSHTSHLQDPEREGTLPWNAPARFLTVSWAKHCQLQCARLAAAAWGNGPLNSSAREQDLLFFKLGSKYTQVPLSDSLSQH